MIAESVSDEFNSNLTLQDRVRLYLNEKGSRHIALTIEKLAKDLKKPEPSVYQVINLLRQRNEIDIVKEPLDNGREKIVGVIVNKLEPSGRTYKRAAERSGRVERIKPVIDSLVPDNDAIQLENLTQYLEKKLAVEDMKTRALTAGLDESVITFTPDPMGEEGILLLKAFTDLQQKYKDLADKNRMLEFDLEAEKRNVTSLKGRLRSETDKMLLENQ